MVGAFVGHLESDGVKHYLNVTEKRNKKRCKILLDAVRGRSWRTSLARASEMIRRGPCSGR